MEEEIIVGIDVGTTKICTLIARVEEDESFRILGVGIEPSEGLRKGMIIDLQKTINAIAKSIEKAQRSSGYEITSALVSIAGSHVSSINSRGAVGITNGVVSQIDINRALEAAQVVAIPHDREVLHVIQRGFTIDGQDGINQPIGMHGYRLEVETHIITASAASVENIRKCVEAAGVKVKAFVLNPLASAEVVLSEAERQLGVMVCDIGGGTTDLAIYINNNVWYTAVVSQGGDLITSDIAYGLRLSLPDAEKVKIAYGRAQEAEINDHETFSIRSFGDEESTEFRRADLAYIIEARIEEIFQYVMQEVKRSGYDGLLPAGVVLTGGSSLLPGIRDLASDVLGLPVRIAQPDNLNGLVDQLYSPAYSTSVGLLKWAGILTRAAKRSTRTRGLPPIGIWERIKEFVKRFLPQ
ncbi:MAG: cell division protein FtsA [Anaerolineaceae bacterium]|jgi:cell division protein FtsA|nr:MAG: cell division protein FtsA [Anaerolineaceae bacterium]